MNTVKFLGTTDEYLGCDCCGKNLVRKMTVALEIAGEIVHYGKQCAGKALAQSGASKSVSKISNIIDRSMAINYANKLVSQGYTPTQVKKAVWTKTGYGSHLVNRQLSNGEYRLFGDAKSVGFGRETIAIYNVPTIVFMDGNTIWGEVATEYDHEACLLAAGWLS